MITELKTYRIKCDRCPEEQMVHGFCTPNLPEGWKNVYVCTVGYSERHADLCPKCLVKNEKEKP